MAKNAIAIKVGVRKQESVKSPGLNRLLAARSRISHNFPQFRSKNKKLSV